MYSHCNTGCNYRSFIAQGGDGGRRSVLSVEIGGKSTSQYDSKLSRNLIVHQAVGTGTSCIYMYVYLCLGPTGTILPYRYCCVDKFINRRGITHKSTKCGVFSLFEACGNRETWKPLIILG
jgi:hypothetical protein